MHFNRLIDQNNLYYAGLRVDGYAIIKKKFRGDYVTLAYVKVIDGVKYDRATNPSLLPKNTPIGIRTEVKNVTNSSVKITLYVDIGRTGLWRKVAEATDDGKYLGAPFLTAGKIGIRTDFLDVQFYNYKITQI